jgi:hypothetical protein
MRIVSTNAMIRSLDGMLGTRDLSEWESGFVSSISDSTLAGKDTSRLTEKQLERLGELYRRHFA